MNRKILVIADYQLGPKFWVAFSSYCKKKDCFGVVAPNKQDLKEYEENTSYTQFYIVPTTESLYGTLEVDQIALLKFFKTFEQETNTLFVDLLQADRHLGKAYAAGGQKYPDSWLQRHATYWESAAATKVIIESINDTLSNYIPDVVLIGGIASLRQKLICVCARMRNIPVRSLWSARYGNRYVWSYDEYRSLPNVKERFHQLNMNNNWIDTVTLKETGYKAHKRKIPLVIKKYQFNGLILLLVRDVKNALVKWLLRFRDSNNPINKKQNIWDITQTRIHSFFEFRRLKNIISNQNIPQSPFVFYPLQLEPEASLMIRSIEFNHQGALIHQISKSLPMGVFLAVKEHITTIGNREKGFYKWVSSFPNVYLVDPQENIKPWIERSSAVITISSTAGFEAAVLGKPVISFSVHNVFNILDHVIVMPRFEELKKIFKNLVQSSEDNSKSKQDGARLLQAMYDSSVDIGEGDLYAYDKTFINQQTCEKLRDLLEKTIEKRIN